MKKIISLLALLSIFSISVFAQETEASPLETTEEQPSEKSEKSDSSDEEKSINEKVKAKRSEVPVDFIISMAPALIINTGNHENSAVSPIVYPFSFGVKFFKNNTIISYDFKEYYASEIDESSDAATTACTCNDLVRLSTYYFKQNNIMYKFISVNIYDKKQCREFEALLNQGWEIKQIQAAQATDGVVVVVAVLYRETEQSNEA